MTNIHHSSDDQAEVSVTAAATQTIHGRSGQVKSRHCKKGRIRTQGKVSRTDWLSFTLTCVDTLDFLLQLRPDPLLPLQIGNLLLASFKQLHHLTA